MALPEAYSGLTQLTTWKVSVQEFSHSEGLKKNNYFFPHSFLWKLYRPLTGLTKKCTATQILSEEKCPVPRALYIDSELNKLQNCVLSIANGTVQQTDAGHAQRRVH